MQALLDESLPRGLARHLTGLNVETVVDHGWSGLKNGELLGRAAAHFDVFITADQNLRYQQNLAGFEIGVVVLAARSNRLADLLPLVARAEAACRSVQPGEVRVVQGENRTGAA